MTTPAYDPLVSHVVHNLLRLGARTFGGGFRVIPDGCRAEPEAGTTTTPEVRLAWLRWRSTAGGGAPRLVLVHGLNANAWIWARVASLLRDRFDVWAVDLRGHGRTSWIEPSPRGAPARPPADAAARFSLASTTRDLLAFLGVLSPEEPVYVAGHSWGGKVATHLAAAAPHRIRGLVLADPVPPAGLNGILQAFPALVRAAFRPERGPFPSRAVAEAMGRRLVYLGTWDESDRRFWAANFLEGPDGAWRPVLPDEDFEAILWGAMDEDVTAILPRISCPVLLLKPTFTVSLLPWEFRDLRRAVPGRFQVRTIPGDHSFVHSNPVDTAAAIRALD